MQKTFLTARWEYLIMANYLVDPALLTPFLPYKTELDLYQNNCYISLVGFLFNQTTIRGFKIPFHTDFEEVNLRFYVRYKQENEYKRGVTFISEVVPKAAIVFVANTIYKEKYSYMPMEHQIQKEPGSIEAAYKWKYKNKWNYLSAKADDTPEEMQVDSEAEFIAEHYWGYSKSNDTKTNEYPVLHPRWRLFPVTSYSIDCDFQQLYGTEFGFLEQSKPASVLLYEGSAVSIGHKNIIR